ncbi:MAG: hypothetical protein AAFR61_23820 [Bacteroidota bacterium]
MASGFIILEDRSCFATRWTGYDEIIRLLIRELTHLKGGETLIPILSEKIPREEDEQKGEMGWGFVNFEKDEIIERELDLRGLNTQGKRLFWQALERVVAKLAEQGKLYSGLNPDRPKELLEKKRLSAVNENPLDHSDWNKLADEAYDLLQPEDDEPSS